MKITAIKKKGSGGAGAGDLLSTNNLSDVASKATSRANLGLSNSTAKIIYVSQDTGSDTNDGSFFRPFQTITAGLASARLISAFLNQVIVAVAPSSGANGYNENITIDQQGITLQSWGLLYRSDAVLIKGTVTVNVTNPITNSGPLYSASSNNVYIHGFFINPASENSGIIFSGSVFQRLFITNTFIQCNGTNGQAVILSNTGLSGGTKSTITSRDMDFSNSSASKATIEVQAGRIFITGSLPSIANSSTGGSILNSGSVAIGSTITVDKAQITGQVNTTDNTANTTLTNTSVTSGAVAPIATPASPNTGLITLANVGLSSSAGTIITGSGIVVLILVAILSSGSGISGTVTQVVVGGLPQGPTMMGATATQNANSLLTLKNGHLTIQQTTAPATTLGAVGQVGTGASRALSNASDTSGKISLTTGTGVLTPGTILTVTFNKTYSNIPNVLITARNSAGAITQFYVTAESTSAFSLAVATALLASTNYLFSYIVLET